MMKHFALPLLFSCMTLGACSDIPKEAFYNHGAPESLLDLSTETVNMQLDSVNAIDELVEWVNRDQPSRAEVRCAAGSAVNTVCARAQSVFNQFSVPAETIPSDENQVVLIYERVMARDCENRVIDNAINPYNLNHPTFGCSMAANMVQMVGDKRQFVSPNLLDFHDGGKLYRDYRNYEAGNKKTTPAFSSLLDSVSSSR